MDDETEKIYKLQAKALRNQRFELSSKPSMEEIDKFIRIETKVEEFLSNIQISGGAEALNVLTLKESVGGPSKKNIGICAKTLLQSQSNACEKASSKKD